jgi:hypothetical protein
MPETQTAAILDAIENVMDDHDLLVGSSITSLTRLREDLKAAIDKALKADASEGAIGTALPGIDPALVTLIATPATMSEATKAMLDDIDASRASAAVNAPNIIAGTTSGSDLTRYPATFTYDGDGEEAYYFAPAERPKGPYLKQVTTEAIINVAFDGTFAGVELFPRGVLPPHVVSEPQQASPDASAVAEAVRAIKGLVDHKLYVLGLSRSECERNRETLYVRNLTAQINRWNEHARLALSLSRPPHISAASQRALLKEAGEFIQPFNRAADLYDRISASLSVSESKETGWRENHEHYLMTIRIRLKQLYEEHSNDHSLREQISDECDWIEEALSFGRISTDARRADLAEGGVE